MDFFTALSTSSFQEAPPPAATGPRPSVSLPRADSFDQQLSAHLARAREMSERSQIASARPAPAHSRRPDAPARPAARPQPKPQAQKPAHRPEAEAKAHPDQLRRPGDADKAKAAPQKDAATKAAHKESAHKAAHKDSKQTNNDQKAVKASATADHAAKTPSDKSPKPADDNLDATAKLKTPFAQSGTALAKALAQQKAAKAEADKKSDDKSKSDDKLVDGLPPGAQAIALPAAVQTPEQSAPSKQGDGDTQSKTPSGALPGTVGELVSEAAKLMKDAKAAKADGTDPGTTGKEAKADTPKASPLPPPFAALLAAAKAGTLKAKPATAADGAPTIKPVATDPTASGAAKATADATRAQATKSDSSTSLAALPPDAKANISAINGQPQSQTANPATSLATAMAAKDAAPQAPAPQAVKADAGINPLPFATLNALGQGPLHINQSPVATPGNSPVAPGAAYVSANVAVQITKTVSDGGNQFSIRLDPAELGRVDVKLHFGHDGHVTAAVSADHQHTLDLLQRDASMLNQALQNSGLKTDQGSLSFSLRQQWQQQQQGQQAFTSGQQGGANAALPDMVAEPAVAASSARQFISNRALDISV